MLGVWPPWQLLDDLSAEVRRIAFTRFADVLMHELSLCRSIALIATRAAGNRPVAAVAVTVGALRQVVPDTLAYCWTLVAEGTLSGSHLDITCLAAEVFCDQCNESSVLTDPFVRCPQCHTPRVELVHGEEFLVTSLELADLPQP